MTDKSIDAAIQQVLTEMFAPDGLVDGNEVVQEFVALLATHGMRVATMPDLLLRCVICGQPDGSFLGGRCYHCHRDWLASFP